MKTWEQRVNILRDSLSTYNDATLIDLVDALEEQLEEFHGALEDAEKWLAGCEDLAEQEDMFAERDDIVEDDDA